MTKTLVSRTTSLVRGTASIPASFSPQRKKYPALPEAKLVNYELIALFILRAYCGTEKDLLVRPNSGY